MACGAVFLDRDGVINENRSDYVKTWEEFRFLPGALLALRELAATPLRVLVVTNQSAIGRGLTSAETAAEIDDRMRRLVARVGGRIDGVYRCPHTPSDGCECRKPRPGLLLRAAAEWGVDLGRSYCVGDKLTDLDAGAAVGCRGILVETGEGASQDRVRAGAYAGAPDLGHAVRLIFEWEGDWQRDERSHA